MRPSAPAGDDGDAIRGIVRLVPYWVFKDLMRAYRKRGQLERALAMVEARRRCGLDVDRFLHNDAIAVCTQAGYGVVPGGVVNCGPWCGDVVVAGT